MQLLAGSLYSQYVDLLRHFEANGFPPAVRYLFLGSYVDRGEQSLETTCLLLAYKVCFALLMNRSNLDPSGLLYDPIWSEPNGSIKEWHENDASLRRKYVVDAVKQSCAAIQI